ncbi:MAG: histidine kinase [Muribaculaceae bacterium]|nr:histidine kinase [Muribaculaceae bacterium]
MEKRLIYILSFFMITVISFELMLTSLVTGHEVKGNLIMLMTLPGIATGFGSVVLTAKVLVPRFLLKGRFFLFSFLTFLTAYATLVLFLLFENIGLTQAGLPPRVESWASPVIFVERACDSMILTILLFSLGAYALYKVWLKESDREKKVAGMLKSYIANVKHRLDPAEIMHRLDSIENVLKRGEECEEEVGERIDSLSAYLRHQLYEMPRPPEVEATVHDVVPERVVQFLTAKKWRFARNFIFQSVLLLMSIEACFPSPDKIGYSSLEIMVAIIMYVFLNFLVAINRFWLRRRFLRLKSARRYVAETVLVVVIPIVVFIVIKGIMTPGKLSDIFSPFWIMMFSCLGAISSFILFEGGVTAIFLLQNWLTKRQRVDMLAAETARQEFLFLKKQINPHFLFNVLNNINILSYEDTGEASKMLGELKRLVEYQFEETSNPFISVGREESFLRSYIGLEASRRDNLEYDLLCHIGDKNKEIPSLLLIPLVENAVKHSSRVRGIRHILIKMEEEEGKFIFECRNNHNPSGKISEVGGIGLRNVRRRLELLYGDDRGLSVVPGKEEFTVTLHIPLKGA